MTSVIRSTIITDQTRQFFLKLAEKEKRPRCVIKQLRSLVSNAKKEFVCKDIFENLAFCAKDELTYSELSLLIHMHCHVKDYIEFGVCCRTGVYPYKKLIRFGASGNFASAEIEKLVKETIQTLIDYAFELTMVGTAVGRLKKPYIMFTEIKRHISPAVLQSIFIAAYVSANTALIPDYLQKNVVQLHEDLLEEGLRRCQSMYRTFRGTELYNGVNVNDLLGNLLQNNSKSLADKLDTVNSTTFTEAITLYGKLKSNCHTVGCNVCSEINRRLQSIFGCSFFKLNSVLAFLQYADRIMVSSKIAISDHTCHALNSALVLEFARMQASQQASRMPRSDFNVADPPIRIFANAGFIWSSLVLCNPDTIIEALTLQVLTNNKLLITQKIENTAHPLFTNSKYLRPLMRDDVTHISGIIELNGCPFKHFSNVLLLLNPIPGMTEEQMQSSTCFMKVVNTILDLDLDHYVLREKVMDCSMEIKTFNAPDLIGFPPTAFSYKTRDVLQRIATRLAHIPQPNDNVFMIKKAELLRDSLAEEDLSYSELTQHVCSYFTSHTHYFALEHGVLYGINSNEDCIQQLEHLYKKMDEAGRRKRLQLVCRLMDNLIQRQQEDALKEVEKAGGTYLPNDIYKYLFGKDSAAPSAQPTIVEIKLKDVVDQKKETEVTSFTNCDDTVVLATDSAVDSSPQMSSTPLESIESVEVVSHVPSNTSLVSVEAAISAIIDTAFIIKQNKLQLATLKTGIAKIQQRHRSMEKQEDAAQQTRVNIEKKQDQIRVSNSAHSEEHKVAVENANAIALSLHEQRRTMTNNARYFSIQQKKTRSEIADVAKKLSDLQGQRTHNEQRSNDVVYKRDILRASKVQLASKIHSFEQRRAQRKEREELCLQKDACLDKTAQLVSNLEALKHLHRAYGILSDQLLKYDYERFQK